MSRRTYSCMICDHKYGNSSMYKRHLGSKKHQTSVTSDAIFCDICKTLYPCNELFNDHKKMCCYKQCTCGKYCGSLNEFNNHDCGNFISHNETVIAELTKAVGDNLLDRFIKITNEHHNIMNEQIRKTNEHYDDINKKTKKIEKEVKTHRKALISLLNEKHPNNPMLTTPNNDEYIDTLEQYYNAENNETYDLQKKIITKYSDKFSIINEIVDIVCMIVKKDDLTKQSIFNSDSSRCNYATKLHKKYGHLILLVTNY